MDVVPVATVAADKEQSVGVEGEVEDLEEAEEVEEGSVEGKAKARGKRATALPISLWDRKDILQGTNYTTPKSMHQCYRRSNNEDLMLMMKIGFE